MRSLEANDGDARQHVPTDLICRPIEPEDRTPLLRVAVADGHKPMLPTHVWVKTNTNIQTPNSKHQTPNIVAYASIGLMAILGGWAHSKEMSDDEALAALALAEEHARLIGVKYAVMPCAEDCRYQPFLAGQGYMTGNASVKLNLKRL
jgi:hypothetical protein